MAHDKILSLTWQHVAMAALAALPATLAALAAWDEAATARTNSALTLAQGKAIEIKIDGRLTQLLDVSTRAAADAATLKEKAQRAEVEAAAATSSSSPKK